VAVVGVKAVAVQGRTSLTTICAPASASPVNISRASPFGLEPKASTITLTT